ncbi:MAG TPA: tryptophanase [Bacillota bacterium]|nr:tryptophanase [Bacillota bacterium]HOA15273.1 tryptophanase [Bacillota bacterium]HOG53336.1 tryptophanase [Bacillota bacterium]
MEFKLRDGRTIPVEMHKSKVVQTIKLLPAKDRLKAMQNAGFNTFLLRSGDVFIDMLTDSGTNAISDIQQGATMCSDDAYAGSESFYRLADEVKRSWGKQFVLPVHQGRAAEHILARFFVKPGTFLPMNYHFTTTKAHFVMQGGTVLELFKKGALEIDSNEPFKGDIDVDAVEGVIKEKGADKVPFVRMEATTNLLGGQPFSLANLRELKKMLEKHGIPIVLDASLVSENAYMIWKRDSTAKGMSVGEILREMMDLSDVVYVSARKSCSGRGGMIITDRKDLFDGMAPMVPLFEGFLTYGGMSSREIEGIAVGIREMSDPEVAGSSVEMIRFGVEKLKKHGVPVLTPGGGLGIHLDASRFLPKVSWDQYPAGCLAAAMYIASGVRGMERGSMSMDRSPDGNQVPSDLELLRLAVPRRVYSASHIEYVTDMAIWLFENSDIIGGLKFTYEPPVLRFFMGRLAPTSSWDEKLAEAATRQFGN